MKKILLTIAIFFGIINCSLADINGKDAISMVENLTKQGIEQIVNSTAPVEEKNRIFKKLFTENLDLDFIGKYKEIGINNFLFAVKDFSIGYNSYTLEEVKNGKYNLLNIKDVLDMDKVVVNGELLNKVKSKLNIDLESELNGPKVVAFGKDIIEPIKAVAEFAKKHDKLENVYI